MSRKAKQICGGISVFFMIATIIETVFMFGRNNAGERQFALYMPFVFMALAVILCVSCVIGLIKNKDFYFKLGIMGGFIAVVGVGIYLGMVLSGISEMLQDANNLKEIIDKSGVWGPIIYIFIQFAQVTFIPIPSTVTVIAGTMVFDMVEVVIYSTIGMILGSMLAFALGKIFGIKLVVWLVGEKAFNKYQKIIKGRDKTMLFLMFLLPVFPDDMLCLVAGITTMSYTTFFLMQVISRPLGICFSSLGGELIKNIPFEGWYIALWVVIVLLVIAMLVLVWKYSGKIEDKIVKTLLKRMNVNSGSTIDKIALKRQVENLVCDTQVVSGDVTQRKRRRAQTDIPNETRVTLKPKIIINYHDDAA